MIITIPLLRYFIHRDVNISDLSSVDINWKMLTLARPANKTDEEIFSK